MLKKINSVFYREVKSVAAEEAEDDIILFEEVGVDSIEFVKFLVAIENELGVKIDEKLWNMRVLKNTKAIADYISGLGVG